jgi:hypothetical protein
MKSFTRPEMALLVAALLGAWVMPVRAQGTDAALPEFAK